MPLAPRPVTALGNAGRVLRGHVLVFLWGGAAGGAVTGLVAARAIGVVWGFFTGALGGAVAGLAVGGVHAVVQAVVLPFVPQRRRRAVAPRLVHVVAVVLAYAAARTSVVYDPNPATRTWVILGALAYAVATAYLAQRVLPRPPGPRRRR